MQNTQKVPAPLFWHTLHLAVTLCLPLNAQCIDECAAHLSAPSGSAYAWAKQSSHSFEEIGYAWNMEFCRPFLRVFTGGRSYCFPQTSCWYPHISVVFHFVSHVKCNQLGMFIFYNLRECPQWHLLRRRNISPLFYYAVGRFSVPR